MKAQIILKTTPRDRERKSAQALRSNKIPLPDRRIAGSPDRRIAGSLHLRLWGSLARVGQRSSSLNPSGSMWLPAPRVRFLAIVLFLTALVLGAAQDAASQTVTLSVPAGTELAEGEGNTTVTVTATLSAARSADTVVDLTLGGTAKSTDYGIVGSLPDITIPNGQTVGTADVTLSPVDDSFFEGEEKIGIGGAATGLTVSGVDVPLADNEQPPTLQLQLSHEYEPGKFRLFSSSTIWDEGDEATIRIAVLLSGGSVFEEDETVVVAHDADRSSGGSLADINFGNNGLPWSIEIQAGSSAGSLEAVSFTIVDDPDAEFNETFVLKAEVSVAGTDFSAVRAIIISESDQPIRFDPKCNSTNFVTLYPGESRKLSCHIKEFNGKKATRNYTVTFTPEDASLIDPDSLEFEVKSGQTSSGSQDITFVAGVPQDDKRVGFRYTGTVAPNDGGEWATDFHVTIHPSIVSVIYIPYLGAISLPGILDFSDRHEAELSREDFDVGSFNGRNGPWRSRRWRGAGVFMRT